MLEGLDEIDWRPYQRRSEPPDFPQLVRDLISPDQDCRIKAYHNLNFEIELNWAERDDDLFFVLIPFLFELLDFPDLPDIAIPLGPLGVMLANVIDAPDNPKSVRLRSVICSRLSLFKRLFAEANEIERDDLKLMIGMCEGD